MNLLGLSTAEADRVSPAPRRTDGHPAGWAAAGVFLVAWVGLPWMAPVAAALPILWLRRAGTLAPAPLMGLRWAGTVIATVAVATGIIGARAVASVPLGSRTAHTMNAWLDGRAGAPPDLVSMLAWTGILIALGLVLRGLPAWLGLAVVASQSAVAAHAAYVRADNLIASTPVAFPLWTVVWLAGMTLVLASFGTGDYPWRAAARADWKRHWVGPGLVVLAFLLRIALAPAVSQLAKRVMRV